MSLQNVLQSARDFRELKAECTRRQAVCAEFDTAMSSYRSRLDQWSAASRVSALRLDDMTTIFPTTLAEFDEEMGLSADLLAAVAQRVREVDTFDGSYEALGASSLLVDNLKKSVNDGQGASFLDLVDPTAAGDDSEHAVHMAYVPLWGPDGPTPQDVRQGGLGSCAILAAAAGVALDDPEHLHDIITDNGDGTYTVVLEGESITVDDEFLASPTNLEYAQNSGALWPLVLERRSPCTTVEATPTSRRTEATRPARSRRSASRLTACS